MTKPIKNPTDVAVTVVEQDGEYVFTDIPDLVFENSGGLQPQGPKFRVRFNLNKPAGCDYCFDDRRRPFEIEDKVPPIKRGKPADQICKVEQVTHQGETLIVINDNIDVRTMKYTLRLVRKGSSEPLTYDPIMSNGGGGGGSETRSLKLVFGILGGIIAAAVIAVVVLESTDD